MIEFLGPISENVKRLVEHLPAHSIGSNIEKHVIAGKTPDVEGADFAIIGVLENRTNDEEPNEKLNLDSIRKEFYKLSQGNWKKKIIDLGDISPGHQVSDSRFALKEIVAELLRLNIIPIILAGKQDFLYTHYRAYDSIKRMISIVNVDSRFDIGDAESEMTDKSYVGHIIFNEPFNLYDYSVIGYQSYFNAPEEIALMDKLYFEAYRLGEVSTDITKVEPVFRNADIAAIDVTAIKSSEMRYKEYYNPNGFDGKEACALARYAGISNSVSSFGIYELANGMDKSSEMLVAQMMWYFVEGVNFRIQDENFEDENFYTTFIVPMEDLDLKFIKSIKSNRWWIEMPFIEGVDNNLKKHTLLPCTEEDYLAACNQEIPERWLKARHKIEINL